MPGKKKGSSNKLRRDIAIFVSILLLAGVGGFVYYHYKDKGRSDTIVKQIHQKASPAATKRSTKNDSTEEQISRQREAAMGADYSEREKDETYRRKTSISGSGDLPRLVLIIDDVANPKELKEIRSIPLRITPSIFPPSKYSKNTVQMAKGLRHYMVHLPMQAVGHPGGVMPDTLMVNDSLEQVQSRVRDIRRWFPHCMYVNNHTGSLFTSNYKALYDLYGILKEERFVFVDSRTTRQTQGERVADEYGDPYLYRDLFIDNIQTYSAIRKQLKLAVEIAKREGYAIAIGHPHPVTLRSIRESLDILAAVDVVYLDELMR